ncbi:NAD(P)H-quinone oxidoreductase [Roseibium denhamense]|uniref:NAD(P)H quinone oxidoreductase, PIG3 family n=1 Tax=Roseibium denhamense TaxID=76305 RepID=A0ABY1NKX4_9HYPH|nr:NAD(P)H-quinone oxidoreductase [Roseibium denhamense]MTI06800.1 NAD(P)H-quinone oxidoreductase [Roseibium denhamense]SMP11433.1 putative NAD(P)H quinone oxidoreductase, PIG3 family [Roseibium denhamense]
MQNLPQEMSAIAISEPGGPEVLKLEKRPLPELESGEILIRVQAAGVNRPDVLQRAGAYPPPKGASDLPGLEVAGEVVSVAPDVDRYQPGALVTALAPGGGYAEFCKVPAGHALPVPGNLSIVEAAALPETFFTVWANVFDRCGLKAGETFLVHGGSSGIGTTAIQLAKTFGAQVFTTVGSDAKADAVKKLGADHVINYRNQVFEKEILEITNGQGVDVILDMVGGDYVERNWKAAAIEGRVCQIATLNGVSDKVNFSRLMVKRLTHTGTTLRPRSVAFKDRIAAQLLDTVWPKVGDGQIRPVMDSTFPFQDSAKAHERMESSSHIGKIVLTFET